MTCLGFRQQVEALQRELETIHSLRGQLESATAEHRQKRAALESWLQETRTAGKTRRQMFIKCIDVRIIKPHGFQVSTATV